MAREPKRIRLEPDTDLRKLMEEVHADRVPRLVERDGEALAVVISPEEYANIAAAPKSKRLKEELLSLAGVWRDLDADALIEYIYKARHESPPSPPVSL